MKVGIIHPPGTHAKTAIAGIAFLVSILRNECDTSEVFYSDYNSSSYYLYKNLMQKMCTNRDTQLFPQFDSLFSAETAGLLERLILDEYFGQTSFKNLIDYPEWLIPKMTSILTDSMNQQIQESDILDKDVLFLVPPNANLTKTMIMAHAIRMKAPKIPVFVMDYYTFDPSTSYLMSFLSGRNYQGEDITPLLKLDPSFGFLNSIIPQLFDGVIIGEGYDVIRHLIGSKAVSQNQIDALEYFSYTLGGASWTPQREQVSSIAEIESDQNRVVVVHSHPIDLNTLPNPDFSDMLKAYTVAQFEFSRGCSFPCLFCERSVISGSMPRFYEKERALEILLHTMDYNWDMLAFWDAAFNINEKRATAFLKLVKQEKLDFQWAGQVRNLDTSSILLNLMRDTGCTEIGMGLESGDSKVHESMRKGNLDTMKKLLARLGEADIKSVLYVILGFPTERPESIGPSIDFINSAASDAHIEIIADFYWPGYIQALSYGKYKEFGIECSKLSAQAIQASSHIFTTPGLSFATNYRKGMSRPELVEALNRYINETSVPFTYS